MKNINLLLIISLLCINCQFNIPENLVENIWKMIGLETRLEKPKISYETITTGPMGSDSYRQYNINLKDDEHQNILQEIQSNFLIIDGKDILKKRTENDHWASLEDSYMFRTTKCECNIQVYKSKPLITFHK